MASVYMRNKATGEIRDVEPDSEEFRELQTQVTSTGLSMWEQTHYPHAAAIKERAAYDELLEEDLGHEDQDQVRHEAVRLSLEGVAPEENPYLALTPGEVEAGLTPKQKLKDLEDQHAESTGNRAAVFSDAAEKIADEKKDRPARQAAKGQSARAGGSDDREDAPVVKAKDEEESSSSSGSSKSSSKSQSSQKSESSAGTSSQSGASA